jgi:hypothetical protein
LQSVIANSLTAGEAINRKDKKEVEKNEIKS